MEFFFRIAALTAAAAILCGCYVSKAPFITPADADYPVATGAHFDAFAPRSTDWRPQPRGRTLHRLGDYYVYVEDGETERSNPFLLKEIAPGRYAVQVLDSETPARVSEYYYQLIDFDGATAIQYSGACRPRQAWLEQMLVARFERLSTGDRCIFTSFDSLSTVLKEAAVNAAPEAKYVLSAAPQR